MWLVTVVKLSAIARNPAYAPAFQDWSEIGPGVSSATLNTLSDWAAELAVPDCAVFPEEQAATAINTNVWMGVEKIRSNVTFTGASDANGVFKLTALPWTSVPYTNTLSTQVGTTVPARSGVSSFRGAFPDQTGQLNGSRTGCTDADQGFG